MHRSYDSFIPPNTHKADKGKDNMRQTGTVSLYRCYNKLPLEAPFSFYYYTYSGGYFHMEKEKGEGEVIFMTGNNDIKMVI